MKSFFQVAVLIAAFCASSLTQAAMQQREWCKKLSTRLASVPMATCEKAKLTATGAESHQKFPILMRTAAADKSTGRPVRILLIGGIHGDELTSVSIVFQWLDLLATPEARKYHWHVAPLVNPDGLFASEPQRVNARGVDLNRNFPTSKWDQAAKAYWVGTTNRDPRRYPGPAPLSEPESRWLFDEIKRFKPDVIFSVHAPFGILDFDGPRNPPERFGRLYLSRVGIFPGSLGNYGGTNLNIPVVTIELPNARSMPPKDEVQRIWRDMLRWVESTLRLDAAAGK